MESRSSMGSHSMDVETVKFSVLVVDDSLINRAILVKILEKFGHFNEIIEVSAGHDAVRLCQQKKFCLIFMDLEMPVMSGEEAAVRIRSLGVSTPIIAVTGNAVRGDDITPLRQAGISEIIKKPVDRQRVVELCKSFVHLGLLQPGVVGTPEGSMTSKRSFMK
ncbi:hypothetical protein HDU98_011478 [Podochytrium sp. JEL0797]|nr:hypothetical protein HDU98_011478 [Podochytrium sp. JEL0797]